MTSNIFSDSSDDTISETRPTDIDVDPLNDVPSIMPQSSQRILLSITLEQRTALSELDDAHLARLQRLFDSFVTIVTEGRA
jgi:hypothetical protein